MWKNIYSKFELKSEIHFRINLHYFNTAVMQTPQTTRIAGTANIPSLICRIKYGVVPLTVTVHRHNSTLSKSSSPLNTPNHSANKINNLFCNWFSYKSYRTE